MSATQPATALFDKKRYIFILCGLPTWMQSWFLESTSMYLNCRTTAAGRHGDISTALPIEERADSGIFAGNLRPQGHCACPYLDRKIVVFQGFQIYFNVRQRPFDSRP